MVSRCILEFILSSVSKITKYVPIVLGCYLITTKFQTFHIAALNYGDILKLYFDVNMSKHFCQSSLQNGKSLSFVSTDHSRNIITTTHFY